MNSGRRSLLPVLLITGITFVVLLGAVLAYTYFSRQNQTLVEIYTIPGDSQVRINDQTGGPGNKYLSPGTYEVEVSRPDFTSQKRTITVKDSSLKEDFILSPRTEKGREWVSSNSEVYEEFEARAGLETQEEGDAFRKNNPIVAFLPYRSYYYNIDYRRRGSDAVIEISADTASGRYFAIEQIKDWGITPSNYQIEFVDLISPWGR